MQYPFFSLLPSLYFLYYSLIYTLIPTMDTASLWTQISSVETRTFEHAGLSRLRMMFTCFPPRILGMDVVKTWWAFVVCRARLHLNPPDKYACLSLNQPPSRSWALLHRLWNPALWEISLELYNSLGNFCVICRAGLILTHTGYCVYHRHSP